ncbi:MAG: PrgI family protein [Candidatus Daviesbacteria bacterium]|nr:MAG: PrgI family protein [Candidatus Daviesbacteria bacterium]
MEAHPIPQNVTAFEFRLVGDMTLKQFLYLSFGMGTAYLIFVFLLPILGFLAWPLITFFALVGVALAFMPIADRPLDYWVKAFLKAVYSPTQWVWSKNDHSWEQTALFSQRGSIISQVVASLETATPPVIAKITPPTQTATIIPAQPTPTAAPVVTPTPPVTPTPTPTPVDLPPMVKNEPIKVVPASKIKPGQLVLTTIPNVINGIITDAAGNYLEGVVVIIYDKTGLPVRALKTNKLGQFSGSTPLPNGTYLIELEKESLSFDKIQINLKGTTLSPLTVSAKKLI